MVKILESNTNDYVENPQLMIQDEMSDFDYIVELGSLIQMMIDIGLLADEPYAFTLNRLSEALKRNKRTVRTRTRR